LPSDITDGPLPRNNDVKVDITSTKRFRYLSRTDQFFADIQSSPTFPEIAPFSSIPSTKSPRKKTVALTDLARNEPRDLCDLWYLTDNGEVQLDQVVRRLPEITVSRKTCERIASRREKKRACGRCGDTPSRIKWIPSHRSNKFFETRHSFRQANLSQAIPLLVNQSSCPQFRTRS
jgi:hypothetical protein